VVFRALELQFLVKLSVAFVQGIKLGREIDGYRQTGSTWAEHRVIQQSFPQNPRLFQFIELYDIGNKRWSTNASSSLEGLFPTIVTQYRPCGFCIRIK
jgi:hypothetical protein